MPRLTNNDFLIRHRFLKRLWEDASFHRLYGLLLPQEQWDVHEYYQTVNTGSDSAILEARTVAVAGDASLPQRAGRAYSKFFYTFQQIAKAMDREIAAPEEALLHIKELGIEYHLRMTKRPAKAGQKTRNTKHRIGPIVNPKIDIDRLANAFLLLAEHLMNEERKSEGKPPLNFPIHRKL